MTANIRTAAQREAEGKLPGDFSSHLSQYRQGFADGAVWTASRVTPTRESIARKLYETCWGDLVSWEDDSELFYAYADAVLALMQELAEGEGVMTDEELRKIAENAKDRASAMAKLANWFTPDAVLALLDRVETAERERDEYRDGTTIVKLTEAEQTLQRVRELHERTSFEVERRAYCVHCQLVAGVWPCPTIQALDGYGETGRRGKSGGY